MIPILYSATESNFNTYGIGALSDAVSCVVTEERNGQYECLLQYPISGKLYSEIAAERILKVKSHPIGNPQLFRIYRISKPLRGIVTIYAQHISYDLSGIPVSPFSNSYTATAAMAYLFTDTPFTGSSDKSGSQTVKTDTPKSIRAMLGGTEGSLLDLWGGEFRWDNFNVYLNTARGSDKDVVIEYGKNLTDLLADHDLTEVYSELLPYATYTDSSGTVHTVMGTAQSITSVITRQKTLIKDFTYILGLDPEVVPTTNQINTAAQSWLSDNPLGYETPSLTVSFVEGEHGPYYPESAARIDLCDTVTIRYTALGVNVKAKVVKTEYDSLLEKYKRLTIGKPRANMADTVATMQDEVTEVKTYPTRWNDAIALATQLITGNTGGYVILHEGPDGKPYELLIMDNPDINSAQNVWRWNLNGLGFSSTGYNGTYATAITSTGMINADFIQTGELNADLIKAGALIIKDAMNNIIFKADADNKVVNIAGFTVKKDSFQYVKTEPSSSDPPLSSKTDTTTVTMGNDGITQQFDYWAESTNSTLYTGSQKLTIITDGGGPAMSIDHDHKNNPDNRGEELAIWKAEEFNIYQYDRYGSLTDYHTSIGLGEIVLQKPNYYKTISADGPTPESSYGTTSVASGTSFHTVGSIGLYEGTYMLSVHASFDSNSTGRRALLVSSSQDSSSPISSIFCLSQRAVDGENTWMTVSGPIKVPVGGATYYINAQQNSGLSKSVYYSYSLVRLA